MDKKLTLGSLFDGSGGFPLGGLLCGIEPLWASEVEPFPIRVTTKRLSNVKHYGDINKIDGATVPPVDIITAGFCCQDLSVAGNRAGLHGERSGLFFQVIRIIKEMRVATNNKYPTFAVLENVPGMYSSNNGLDFLEVLNELIKIKNETLSVYLPENGKWSTAGEVVGDGFSVGWRTLDAQFWGVAQRRRRCYIVVDFTGERAGEILFDESRLRRNPPQSGFARQATAGDSAAGVGSAVNVLNDQGGSFMDISEEVTGTLRSQEHGHQPIVFEPGITARLGRKGSINISSTLRADMGDNQTAVAIPINTQVGLRNHKDGDGTGLGVGEDGDSAYTIQAGHSHAVAIENRPQDSRVKINEDGVVQTLDARMGMGGGNVPLVMNERQYALTVGEDVANTLTGTDFKGTQCVFEPKTLKIRCGQGKGGKGALVQDNMSATLSTSNDQTVFVPKVYGICSKNSNSMKSANPHSGIYEAETARTLDTTIPDPNKNAGGMAVVSVQGSMIGRKPENGPQGSGIGDDVSFTLTEADRHSIAYSMTCGSYTQVCEEKSPTLMSRDYKDAPVVVSKNQYIVRRLTPIECALLQGFPPDWCSGLETSEPTDEDISFWSEIWETHRNITGTSNKPKSRNQIIKWLKNPHSDSAEYKMWGNGVALPCVIFVLDGIVKQAEL
ncbi:MAG: DNA cytosine methyltransferase [Oscillospiraceae bacterium]|nr:DNA cytosine methyltransferase [Oscillospiraceae bacterium]